MNVEQKDIWTTLYLDGTLTGTDLDAFRQQLHTDKEIQLCLALHRQGRALLGEQVVNGDEMAFRHLLAEPTAQYFSADALTTPETGDTHALPPRPGSNSFWSFWPKIRKSMRMKHC